MLFVSMAHSGFPFCDSHGSDMSGRRVLELGSGTGVLGLCLARGGASVTLTDRFDVLALLRASVALNADLAARVAVRELSWGEAEAGEPVGELDWIVASEVVYNGLLYDKLMCTIGTLFRANPRARLFMAFERRSSEDRWMQMVRASFGVVETDTVSLGAREVVVLTLANPLPALVSPSS